MMTVILSDTNYPPSVGTLSQGFKGRHLQL
jgi:hypothetical protein